MSLIEVSRQQMVPVGVRDQVSECGVLAVSITAAALVSTPQPLFPHPASFSKGLVDLQNCKPDGKCK